MWKPTLTFQVHLRFNVVEEEIYVENGLYRSADPHEPLSVIPSQLQIEVTNTRVHCRIDEAVFAAPGLMPN